MDTETNPGQEFCYCQNCGQQLPASAKFCDRCGQARVPTTAPPPLYAPVATVQANNAHKLSGVAKTWIIVCIIANAVIWISLMALSSESGDSSALVVLPGMLSLGAVVGYSMLLARKKAGFYVVCVCAGIMLVLNLISLSFLRAVFSAFNPVITWLLVRELWEKD